jgi:hypothetical protein
MSLQGGGEETRALDQPWGGFDWGTRPQRHYLIYMTPVTAGVDPADPTVMIPPKGMANIGFLEFATGKSTLISRLEKAGEAMGLAVSPHGRSILFVQNEFSESNIMLNNFR